MESMPDMTLFYFLEAIMILIFATAQYLCLRIVAHFFLTDEYCEKFLKKHITKYKISTSPKVTSEKLG